MKEKDYHTYITVNAPGDAAFNCINNVSRWWTENLEGHSEKQDDEFTVRFGNVHYSKQKLVEFIPGKKVVWLVTGSKLNFIKDKQEWTGTKIVFEVMERNGQTEVNFTHAGLVPGIECFEACSNAWAEYIQGSLLSLINTGKGQPAGKEK